MTTSLRPEPNSPGALGIGCIGSIGLIKIGEIRWIGGMI